MTNLEQPSTPGPEHRRLDVFVGTWNTKGRTRASGSEPAIEIVGTDSYEWLPGGFFLIHRVDVHMGSEKVDALEIIGYDVASQSYPTRFFDSQGNTGTYEASVRDGIWTFATDSTRATVTVGSDGHSMTIHWERVAGDDQAWVPWMDLELTRARPSAGGARPFAPGARASG